MTRTDILRMIKRRAHQAGLPSSTSCHTFRATGITAYLENGGTLENAQAIAAHASPKTTMLNNHTGNSVHFTWAINPANGATRALSAAARGLERSGRPN